MGVGIHDLNSIISLRQLGLLPQKGAIVEIGAQQMANSAFDSELLQRFGMAFGIDGEPPLFEHQESAKVHGELVALSPSAPPFRTLWRWVDWTYAAIDVDGSKESVPLDLNFDAVPAEMRNRFDLVTNFGTTEHIANQYVAFKAIHDLCAVGGLMTHFIPSMGMPNHGLVSYNPKFFWMLCRSNEYQEVSLELLASTPNYTYPYPPNPGLKFKWTDPSRMQEGDTYPVLDMMVRATVRKQSDASFVAPLDVPNGSKPIDDKMRDRYWTLFGGKPNPVEA